MSDIMNPTQEDDIINLVRRINIHHGGCTVQHVTPKLKAMGFDDPGRELRRLADKNKLIRWKTGVYYAKNTRYAQGLGKFWA